MGVFSYVMLHASNANESHLLLPKERTGVFEAQHLRHFEDRGNWARKRFRSSCFYTRVACFLYIDLNLFKKSL